ncbi:Cytochrome P450 3A14 [Fusarium acutatum]|uniref:Cytochrome P450 3A14 n=1 Tax=Fusarium acutatum TaxID=78861 RepID=A0A8H4NHA5_9HYPO|nr:Cytochrome P450 3A14 [Fusarium acutatum]
MYNLDVNSMSWLELTAGGLSIFLLLFYLYNLALPKPIPGIPYNQSATKRLLGDLPDLFKHQKQTGEQRRWFALQNQKFNSPVCQVFIRPFGKPRVILSDFREAYDILSKRLREFDRSERAREAFAGIIPHQMLAYQTVDPKFKKHRELMRDLMSPKFLNQVSAPEIYSKVNTLVRLWHEKCLHAAELPFDGKRDIQRATLDDVTAVSFGLDDDNSATKRQLDDMLARSTAGVTFTQPGKKIVDFPVHPLAKELDATLTIVESSAVGLSSPIPRWHYWILYKLPYLKKAARVREEWTRREIDKAVETISKDGTKHTLATRSVLEFMVLREEAAARKAERPPRFHRRRIYDELFGFIIAGHDTTAATLSWGVRYIADAPLAQEKLRSLLQNVFSAALAEHRQPTTDEIISASIPYLDAVIEEILRLSAVLPIVSRVAMVDTTILGHVIPKGTSVFFTLNGPRLMKTAITVPEAIRSESSQGTKSRYGEWRAEDVEQFIPERWIDVDDKGVETFNAMKGPFLTFGSGPRGCFGRRLAYLQLRIFWVLLMWNFEFLPVDSELRSQDVVEHVGVEPHRLDPYGYGAVNNETSGTEATPQVKEWLLHLQETPSQRSIPPLPAPVQSPLGVSVSQSGTTGTPAPALGHATSQALELNQLHLLHHWKIHTSVDLCRCSKTLYIWQEALPQVGFQYQFVLHALLGLAALHIAYTSPTERARSWLVGMYHHNEALTGFRRELSFITEENSEALFTWSLCNVLYVFTTSNPLYQGIDGRPTSSTSVQKEKLLGSEWIPMIRGLRAVLEPTHNYFRSGSMKAIMNLGNWDELDPAQESQSPEDANFCRARESWRDSDRAEVYEEALQVLRKCRLYSYQFREMDSETRSN